MPRPFLTHCKRGHKRTPESLVKDGRCKKCLAFTKRLRYAKNPSKEIAISRNNNLKRMGWTLESFEKARVLQINLCALCHEPFTEDNGPVADHKHVDPPKPRGLLHSGCNLLIGFAQESPEVCEAAARYLRFYASIGK